MTNQGVNIHLPPEGQFSAAVDTTRAALPKAVLDQRESDPAVRDCCHRFKQPLSTRRLLTVLT